MAEWRLVVVAVAVFLPVILQHKHLAKASGNHHDLHAANLHWHDHSQLHAKAHKQSQTFSVVVDHLKPQLSSFVRLLNPQETFVNGHRADVEYSCQEGDLVAVQIFIQSDDLPDTSLRVFHYDWMCHRYSSGTRRTFVQLTLPDWLAYRPDYAQPNAYNVDTFEVRVWIISRQQILPCVRWQKLNCHESAHVKAVYPMRMAPVYQRPRKNYKMDQCLDWSRQIMLSYLQEEKILRCRLQEEIVQLVDFPVAFSEVHSGITKDLSPFQEIGLVNQQRKHKFNPKFTISTKIFLLKYCSQSLCGILHRKSHISNDYITPLLFLTNKGLIHIQVVQEDGQASGMVSNYKIPLRQWVRLIYKQDGSSWTLLVSSGPNLTNIVLSSSRFTKPVRYEEAEGLIHFGGSSVCRAFSGFIADTWLWRTRVIKQEPQWNSSAPILMEKIESYFSKCDDLHEKMLPVYEMYLAQRAWLLAKRSCANSPSSILGRHSPPSSDTNLPVCLPWERHPPRGQGSLWRALRTAALQNRPYRQSYEAIGKMLHERAVKRLASEGLSGAPSIVTYLRQASCYGNHESSYMLGTLYAGGVNVDADQNEAYLHWLVAAQVKNRLAMLALASHHYQGLNAVPKDFDFSYNYLKNLADLTVTDRERHDPNGVMTEYVRLTDTAALQVHKGEDGDHFLWLKYQAKKGIAQAQLDMARILFWGQRGVERDVGQAVDLYRLYLVENPLDEVAQYDFGIIQLRATVARLKFWGSEGVKRDMQTAVKYYAKSVQEMPQNPVALYDYGIVLLRGQGIEKNVDKALDHLNKSAELGHAPAYTALGWYAINFQKDMRKAAKYFDIADRMGHRDAMHNLGYMYKAGRYPGQPADEAKALWYFQRAADRGHIDSSGVVAEIYNQGSRDVARSGYKAVYWSRLVCEQNPQIGVALRKGLDAYLAGSWGESIVYYMMVAEAGLEVAQFNLAYLCEEDPDGQAATFLRTDCIWKYYNLSSHAPNPHVVAQLKMGDFHYYGYYGKQDRKSAVQYYALAAKMHDPQLVKKHLLRQQATPVNLWTLPSFLKQVRVEASAREKAGPKALFNLAYLVEEGAEVDSTVWKSLGIPSSVYDAKDNSQLVMTLYTRCRDGGNKDAYLPCGLALLRVQLMTLWGKHTLAVQVSSALVLGLLMLLCLTTCLHRIRQQGDASPPSPAPPQSSQD